jgi:hypothetical protein
LKKIATILLLAVYIAFSSGIALNVHYCMGEFSGVAIGKAENDVCGTCGMDNTGCCHDDFKVVKLTDNHQPSLIKDDFQKISLLPAEPVSAQFADLPALLKFDSPQVNSPPPPKSLNILYCVFRI